MLPQVRSVALQSILLTHSIELLHKSTFSRIMQRFVNVRDRVKQKQRFLQKGH
jgi:predicted ATP-dependent endonuclease of OLD family